MEHRRAERGELRRFDVSRVTARGSLFRPGLAGYARIFSMLDSAVPAGRRLRKTWRPGQPDFRTRLRSPGVVTGV
jgi:hypothetical protein